MATTEWGTVTAQWPGPGQKVTKRKNREKAEQAVLDADHHTEMLVDRGFNNHWHVRQTPLRVVSREVTDWEVADEAE